MEEKLWESIQKTADVLHWFGKYRESNALVLTSRLMRVLKIESLKDWELFVETEERAKLLES